MYINDIDATFVDASQQLANQLNIKMDGYITGDISTVKDYFKYELPDAIVGTDVIEHIYNLEHFFSNLQQINPSIISVFTTASNPKNYFKVRTLKKLQIKDELKGGTPDDYILFGEFPLEPFIKIREQIIKEHNDSLPDQLIFEMAKATRGKNEQDIISVVQEYKISGQFPTPSANNNNTGDPLNGS